jgi:hypothetical protein
LPTVAYACACACGAMRGILGWRGGLGLGGDRCAGGDWRRGGVLGDFGEGWGGVWDIGGWNCGGVVVVGA